MNEGAVNNDRVHLPVARVGDSSQGGSGMISVSSGFVHGCRVLRGEADVLIQPDTHVHKPSVLAGLALTDTDSLLVTYVWKPVQ